MIADMDQKRPSPATVAADQATPQRRHKVEHVWPEIGTRLDGEFMGESYAVLVVVAPKLKSGRALQLINSPVMGQTFNSMTAAMLAATAAQRRKLGQGKSKKGLPKSGVGLLEGSGTPADVGVANWEGAACGRPFPSREIPR